MGDAGPPGNVGPDGPPGQKCDYNYNGRYKRASKRNLQTIMLVITSSYWQKIRPGNSITCFSVCSWEPLFKYDINIIQVSVQAVCYYKG